LARFYTNVFARGDKIYLRGYDMGLPVKEVINYQPYHFMPSPKGKYKTLDGQTVDKLMHDSISDARDFMKRYEDVKNMQVYGSTAYPYLFIYDNYKGEIDYDPATVNVVTIDIECKSDDGFPDIEKADKPLTSITIRSKGQSAVFGLKDFHTNDPKISYLKCKDEHDMVAKFIQVWQSDAWMPDIVTGWNIEFFDIPYLINRVKVLFNEKEAKKLSPWGILEERTIEFRGKENQTYGLAGVAVLDYYQLYRKFSYTNQESYKLDYISMIELGEKKVDYRDQGYRDLADLYERNHQLFIEYNIKDCVLVDKLDEKMKFIEQVMAMAYDAKVNYNDTMTTVRAWDTIIHNYLLDQGIVIPQFKPACNMDALVGGHVKEPKVGLTEWVVSFDLNSLYPHLIMQYNISPETFAGRKEFPSIDRLLDGTWEYRDGTVAYAANGCTYRKDKQGFLPALMEKMYNDRAEYKKKMIEAKKSYEQTKSKEDSNLISRYHNMQLAKKIQLNSAYGALGNKYFRWFNFDHAEAITMSGQLSIRWIEKKMNQFMNKLLKTDNKDYVIASDTDSIYLDMSGLVGWVGEHEELKIVKALDEFIEARIQPYMDKSYQELADMMNAYQQKMKMKRETIANKGIWKAKKMYILNAWNVEGVQYDKPKLKIQGIEAVRSSTPYACRENIKTALSIIMNGNEQQLQEFVVKFKQEFNELPFEDVSFPRGIKGMDKYKDKAKIYKLGTPIQVKGALLFNNLLKQHGMKNVQPIGDGDKIRFAYLKIPNPIHDTVIAVPEELPKEFKLDKYIDRDMQFSKSFLDPLRSITEVVDWKVEQTSTLEDFFG